MKRICYFKYILIFILLLNLFLNIPIITFAQDTSRCKKNYDLGLTTDLVSRYIWRGQDYYNNPSIQPTLFFSWGGFTICSWGSFSVANTDIQETHLFTSYTYKFISLGVYDYFFMDYARDPITGSMKCNNYFEYGKETKHVLEADMTLSGPEKLPLKFFAAYNFYGNDNNKSTYFELSYTGSIKKTKFDAFLGCTPQKGWYGTTSGIVNVGVTGYKSIKINENYEILFKTSLITNPQAENIYLVFGITL